MLRLGSIRLIAFVLAATMLPGPGASATPSRVVSMNVCTDQLAMLVAAPGQLYSISFLGREPGASALAEQASDYPVNHGLAEEIFLMKPDLVLAGTFTTRATVSMLRRLDFAVEEFAPETTFDEVRENLRRMGRLLGRESRADELVAELDRGLAALPDPSSTGETVATYSANSYTAGQGSLTHAVIAAAGFRNLGAELGIQGAGRLPLETLVLKRPEILTQGTRSPKAPALAEQNFRHPAYNAVRHDSAEAVVPEAYWICGGPFTLIAAQILQSAARQSESNAISSR